MVHIERFILPCPNLISMEGLGTLPEHCLRSLGKLLGQLPIFGRDCSSLPGSWNVSRRGMPSHSIFDGSLYIGVPLSSSRPSRTHDVSVVDTSLIYYSHFSLTLCQLLRGSRAVFSLPDTFRIFCHSGLYPAVWPFGRCWG